MIPEENFARFEEINLTIDENKYKKLVQKDIERERIYGKVLIKIRELKRSYLNGKNEVLKGINLEIREGEFLAILGNYGCGKTTLINHLNGLLLPTEGTVMVNGKDTIKSSIHEIGREVGCVFQNSDHQIFANNVYDEVAFSLKVRGCSKEEIELRVKEALKSVEMEDCAKEDPSSLSKGEKQRIAVAAVLAARPNVIILDEPTTGLDYKEQRKMMELIRHLNNIGHTIIIITRTMWVVAEYAHKVMIIEDGIVTMYGRTREVFKNEDKLLNVSLNVPKIVSLSNRQGKTLLSVEEMEYVRSM